MKKEEVKQYVKKWMDSHEADTFIKNQNGVVIYSAGPSSLNLTVFFEELLNDYFESMEEYANQPKEALNEEQIKKLASIYSNGKSSEDVFRKAHEVDFITGFKKCLELTQPTPIAHELTAKEEAERLVGLYGRSIRGDDKIHAMVDISNTITALELRGIDASYEKEVLHELRGM